MFSLQLEASPICYFRKDSITELNKKVISLKYASFSDTFIPLPATVQLMSYYEKVTFDFFLILIIIIIYICYAILNLWAIDFEQVSSL